MRLSIKHTTIFDYSLPARSNINEVRLAPEENEHQIPGELSIQVDPIPETGLTASRDLYGNLVHSFEVEAKHIQLSVFAQSIVETTDQPEPRQQSQERPWQGGDEVKSDDLLYEFLNDSQYVKKTPEIWREAIDVSLNHDTKTWGTMVHELNAHIFKTCQWSEQLIHQATSAETVRQARVGTCQDFSHLLIGYLRALGVPARYVSGYLYDPGLQSGDAIYTGASVSHAWVDFYTPEVGWVGIDPTNNCWVRENYVSIAKGRDYHDVAPIRGNLLGGGPKRSLDVSVVVEEMDKQNR